MGGVVLRRLPVGHCYCELVQARQQVLHSSACSPANGGVLRLSGRPNPDRRPLPVPPVLLLLTEERQEEGVGASYARRITTAQGASLFAEGCRPVVVEVPSDSRLEEDETSTGCDCRTLKLSPPPKSQSSKNRCHYPYGECLQPQKGVAPPCLTETQTISNRRSSGNFGVKRGLGWWRGRKRFGMAGCPMRHRRSIQSSPWVLLWVNDFVPKRYRKG